MLRKKFLRGVFVFSALIIAFSSFGLTASAKTVSVFRDIFYDLDPTIDDKLPSGSSVSGNVCSYTFADTFSVGQHIVKFVMQPKLSNITVPMHQSLKGKIRYSDENFYNQTNSAGLSIFSFIPYYFDDNDNKKVLNGSYEPNSWGYEFSFSTDDVLIDKPIYYSFSLCVTNKVATKTFEITFTEFEYTCSTEEELQTDRVLYDWDSSGASPDSSAFDELGGLEDGIANSTGKLLIGYDTDGNPIYEEGTLNDLGKKGLSTIYSSVKEYMNNPKALMALTNFVSDLAYTPEIATVLTYSLALAVIPLILGLGINAMKGSDRRAYLSSLRESRRSRKGGKD